MNRTDGSVLSRIFSVLSHDLPVPVQSRSSDLSQNPDTLSVIMDPLTMVVRTILAHLVCFMFLAKFQCFTWSG
jgi:hypothetical protein